MYFEVDGSRTFAAGRLPADAATPVILLVHGAAMDHSVWVYHTRYFMHTGHAVVAVDLPAHGLSAGAPLTTIEDMAAWLERCLDALGIERAAVAGHSMGALAALELGGRAGARIERLALLGCALPMAVAPALLEAAQADSPVARDMMVLWGHGTRAHTGGNPVAGITMVNAALRLIERARPGLLHADLAACNAYTDGYAAAAKISARTRLICGSEDRMTPTASARELATVIPTCAVDVIADCGHIMMSEKPEQTHRFLVQALA
ncbi:MAG: alpha/beta hydrolase [Gammaproteobacteria bacterium]